MNRRTDTQKAHDRAILAEKKLLGWTDEMIKDHLTSITGRTVTIHMVHSDGKVLRTQWLEQLSDDYKELMAIELERVRQEEELAWRNYFAAVSENKEREELTQVALEIMGRSDGEDEEEFVSGYTDELFTIRRKVVTEGNDQVALAWFDRAVEARKERRRILGLHAPKRHRIDVHEEKIEVKAYVGIDFGKMPKLPDQSPPDIIDGEILDDSD